MEQLQSKTPVDDNYINLLIKQLSDNQSAIQKQVSGNTNDIIKIEKENITTAANINDVKKDIRLLSRDVNMNNKAVLAKLKQIDEQFADYQKKQDKKEKDAEKILLQKNTTVKNTIFSAFINTIVPVLLGFLGAGIVAFLNK